MQPVVNLGSLRQITLPVPASDVLKKVVERLTAARAVAACDEEVSARAARLGQTLAVELLSGTRPIPDSYDRFLDGAA